MEKNTEARDNAYWLYKYVRENFPVINAYFVITPNAFDRDKLLVFGEERIIDYGSFKHYIYALAALYNIGSQAECAYPIRSKFVGFFKRYLKGMPKSIFLQHGVIENDLCKELAKKRTGLDFFATSARCEYEDICKRYGYTNNEVQLTGLCRFDHLKKYNGDERVILLMPTWRMYLAAGDRGNFETSRYFKAYQSLLDCRELHQYLREYGYKMIFYPHYACQKYLNSFQKTSDRIILADKEHYDVQDLLVRANILITDFSSVHFDFAYMHKPLIYYQFDEEDFWGKHYSRGYFSYLEHGFGPVCKTEEEVLDSIRLLLKNNAVMDPYYLKRAAAFFAYSDDKNCERTFEAILKI